MKTNELVTIAIIGYRQYRYIYCAIDSILAQNYEAIELIISDDGSDSFPKKEIADYIERNKQPNIKRVVLNHESENNGTVKHFNKVVSLSTGTYFMLLAADDALHDETVIEKFVRGFANADEDCYVEMAQTAMYDEKLEEIEGYYLRPCIRKLIEGETNSRELYKYLLDTACLPTNSTFYKMSFFAAFGSADESYRLIEDVPTHVRLAREGWKIHYENFVATKHRSGGISHGATEAQSKTKLLFYKDALTLNKNLEQFCKTDFNASSREIKMILRSKRFERNMIKNLLSTNFAYKKTFKAVLYEKCLGIINSAYFFMAASIIAILYAPQIATFCNRLLSLQNPIDAITISVILCATLALGTLWLLVGYIARLLLSVEILS